MSSSASYCCSSSASFLSSPHRRLSPFSSSKTLTLVRPHRKPLSLSASMSDPFVLEIAEKLEDSLSLSPYPPLKSLRDTSAESLLSTSWPTRKSDPFRFTDISFLRKYPIIPAQISNFETPAFSSSLPIQITLNNGVFNSSLAQIPSLPAGVFIGSIKNIPEGPISDKISSTIASSKLQEKDIFYDLNNVGAADMAVIYIPHNIKVQHPIHLIFCYNSDTKDKKTMTMSNPRVLIVAEEDSEVSIVEEHFGVNGSGCYWANPVMEIVIGERARVSHSYLQRQPVNAAHIKWTIAQQEASSTYEHIEVSIGGKLSRHNLHIDQRGPETVTELSTFQLVSQSKQIQDLHSRLVLDHPKGVSRQLHKCIVCQSDGQAVFDGNIRVNRFAQQTDAGQQTRSLLLAPKATVNVKPNLQIIADDVKCAHGAAISDLDENQLFYFQARGLDLKTARNALVYYFGMDVIRQIPFKEIRETAGNEVKKLLESSVF